MSTAVKITVEFAKIVLKLKENTRYFKEMVN